jgi:hypothetical protein
VVDHKGILAVERCLGEIQVAFGVDIGNLLDLEGAFEGGGERVVLSGALLLLADFICDTHKSPHTRAVLGFSRRKLRL